MVYIGVLAEMGWNIQGYVWHCIGLELEEVNYTFDFFKKKVKEYFVLKIF
jgi:hypothetical protein